MANNAANRANEEKSISTMILPNKEKILSSSYEDKVAYLRDIKIAYPKMTKILSLIEKCFNSTKDNEQLCIQISGPSGTGKTTFKDIYQKRYPDINTPEGIEKPIFYSRVPCPAYIGGLPSKLLYDLGDPFYDKKLNTTISTQRLYKLLNECKVKMIFLDEVQHLVDRNSQKLLKDSSDWFKDLIDETGIPTVFLGMPDSDKIFTENIQIRNRVLFSEHTTEFSFDNDFRKFLYLFDASLPLNDISGLSEMDMSKRIFQATGGVIKHVRDIIVESTEIALKNNSSRITMPIMAYTFETYFYNLVENNPFTTDINYH